MSHSERFAAAPDENMSLHALGLNEMYASLISLMANHDQLSAYHAAGARQSLRSTLDWHALYTSTLRRYFTHGAPPPAIPYVLADPLGGACIKLDRIEDQMLAREIDMTMQQMQMCERLMANLATMIEKLREDEACYKERRREEEALASETQWEAKGQYMRAWIESCAVVKIEDDEHTDGVGKLKEEARE